MRWCAGSRAAKDSGTQSPPRPRTVGQREQSEKNTHHQDVNQHVSERGLWLWRRGSYLHDVERVGVAAVASLLFGCAGAGDLYILYANVCYVAAVGHLKGVVDLGQTQSSRGRDGRWFLTNPRWPMRDLRHPHRLGPQAPQGREAAGGLLVLEGHRIAEIGGRSAVAESLLLVL